MNHSNDPATNQAASWLANLDRALAQSENVVRPNSLHGATCLYNRVSDSVCALHPPEKTHANPAYPVG
jgi:hypothetical protein